MSAFILSDKHIGTIARLLTTADNAQEFADQLKRANIASVNHRYSEKTRTTKCKVPSLDDCITITMDDLVSLCQCWDYQACEGDKINYIILSGFIDNTLTRLGYGLQYESNSKLWSI